MKVSRREYLLLIILLTAGACYFLYTFLYSPMLRDIATAIIERQLSREELHVYENTIARYDLDALQAEQQALIEDIEDKAESLLPYIDYSEITSFIDQIAQSQSVEIYAVKFSAEELIDTAPTAGTGEIIIYPLQQRAEAFRSINNEDSDGSVSSPPQAATPTTAGQTQSNAVVNRLTVDIQLDNVTYSQILGFIKQLESYGRAIYLENILISDESGINLKASLVYGFMQADKLTDTDEGLAEVIPAEVTGKSDPFSPGSAAQPPQTTETTDTQDAQAERPAE